MRLKTIKLTSHWKLRLLCVPIPVTIIRTPYITLALYYFESKPKVEAKTMPRVMHRTRVEAMTTTSSIHRTRAKTRTRTRTRKTQKPMKTTMIQL